MKRRSDPAKSFIAPLVLTTFVLVVTLTTFIAFPKSAMAQKQSDAQLKVALYECLKSKFPGVSGQLDRGLTGQAMFDPHSGRNFAWDSDKQAWIDTKTLEGVCPISAPGQAATPKQLQVALYDCLKSRFPGVSGQLDRGLTGQAMFDPHSGRNFAWDSDKQAWIDTKTLECVCPVCPPAAARTISPTDVAEEIQAMDARTAGTPKPSEETQKVEEKTKSWWESLIPSIGIGVGGGTDRERRDPKNPCSGK